MPGWTQYLPNHKHISEREADGTWEDCTFDAGLEWYRSCFDPSKPATHAEAQAIRKASGKPATGGANQGDFRQGVKVRYGKVLPLARSNQTILADLKPGMAASVQGSMKAFGPGHHLSTYDRNFDGAHDVFLARLGNGRLFWCDPEAPQVGKYQGTYVVDSEVTAFVKAFPGGQSLIGTVILPPPPPVPPVDPKLYSQKELDAAVEAATQPLEDKLNTIHDISNLQ